MTDLQEQETELNGTTIKWSEGGDGTPLVLIHGIPTSRELWRHVVPLLSGAHVYNWEMVGYGESIPAGQQRDLSVARQAQRLISWMDDQGVEQAVFAGHDLGGGVAQIAAVEEPARCAGLFLTNSIGYDSWPIPSVRLMQAARPAVAATPKAVLDGILTTFIHRGHDAQDRARESAKIHVEPYRRTSGGRAFARQIQYLKTEDTQRVEDGLRALDTPARIVWGAADQFQKVEYGERFAMDLGARLVEIPDGKHFTPEDHPQTVAHEINGLVEDVAGTGA